MSRHTILIPYHTVGFSFLFRHVYRPKYELHSIHHFVHNIGKSKGVCNRAVSLPVTFHCRSEHADKNIDFLLKVMRGNALKLHKMSGRLKLAFCHGNSVAGVMDKPHCLESFGCTPCKCLTFVPYLVKLPYLPGVTSWGKRFWNSFSPALDFRASRDETGEGFVCSLA